MNFRLNKVFPLRGDQQKTVDSISKGIVENKKFQTILGVTGSGKTYVMANIIERVQRPTLIIAHNKTLAAQLYLEFKEFFPENSVNYFVSYYDYYQPEAYIPQTDTYIDKEVKINKDLDRLRIESVESIISRPDTIIVASVSCIYNIGLPQDYIKNIIEINIGEQIPFFKFLDRLVYLGYKRSIDNIEKGTFRVRGDRIDIFPISLDNAFYSIEFFADEIEGIFLRELFTSKKLNSINSLKIFPVRLFMVDEDRFSIALQNIKQEMEERYLFFKKQGMLLEAERIKNRTLYDLEVLKETGTCHGVENYSRHLSFRKEGEPPYTLLDYFSKDFIIFIDESHVTIPQLNGMYRGDRARKKSLIDNGFRLPSAYDNRPLRFNEFLDKVNQVIFVSATPSDYEYKISENVVELIVRPTGLVDPEVELRRSDIEIEDVIKECKKEIKKGNRVLISTLTKKMAEDLSIYLLQQDIKAKYLHSEIDTLDRVKLLNDLRKGNIEVIVGVNLLREGLDLPEVGLVAILDADNEGFLRSKTSLIQTMGRAARNIDGRIIIYANNITKSIKEAIKETNRRRKIQLEYNKKHNIKPKTIKKEIVDIFSKFGFPDTDNSSLDDILFEKKHIKDKINQLTQKMNEYAKKLEFEKAIIIRDKIIYLKNLLKDKKIN